MKLQEQIVETIKTEEIQTVTTDIAETIVDIALDEGILKDIPIIGTIVGLGKGYLSIQDRLFTKKILTFINQLKDIPEQERREQIEKIELSKKYRISVGEKLLYIIEKADDHEKSQIIGLMFAAFLKGEIDYEVFVRCSDIINKSNIDDINWIVEKDIDEMKAEEAGDFISTGMFELAPLDLKLEEEYEENYQGEHEVKYKLHVNELSVKLSYWGGMVKNVLKKKSAANKA